MPYGVTESQPAVAESRIIGRDDVTRRPGGGCPLSSAIGISRAVSTADRAVSAAAGPCAGEQSYRVGGCIITVKPSLSARRARYIYILKGPIRHAEFAYRFYVHPDRRIMLDFSARIERICFWMEIWKRNGANPQNSKKIAYYSRKEELISYT